MTKEQLMQFIEVDSEEDKDDCEFYLDVKGVEIHRAIMEYLQFDFLEGSKIKWSIISQKLKEDKNLRYKLYTYLATLEEYIRAYISNKYQGNIHQNFWIDGKAPWNKIKTNLQKRPNLFEVLQDTDFGTLINQVKNLPQEDLKEIFDEEVGSEDNLNAVVTQNENISTELKQYNTTIDVTVQRYNGIVQQLDNKITELKKMKAEQKHLNPIHIFRHKELTEHIDKTEKEIKKLQNLKSAFLDKMSCKSEKDIPQYKALHIKNDDIIIEIAANNTELEKQCADDKAEFISIKKSIPSEDMVAVQAERYTIHDEYTKSNIQKLQEKYGRKYSYDIYKDVEADVNMELHEKPFSILMRLEKNKQRNTDHNHTKYRNHEQER